MKTYIIDKIGSKKLNGQKLTAESIAELEQLAIRFADMFNLNTTKIYVHCSHIITDGKNWSDEQNVEYVVRMNNQKHTLTTKRI